MECKLIEAHFITYKNEYKICKIVNIVQLNFSSSVHVHMCGYSLEPPQPVFEQVIRKIMNAPVNPTFQNIEWDFHCGSLRELVDEMDFSNFVD